MVSLRVLLVVVLSMLLPACAKKKKVAPLIDDVTALDPFEQYKKMPIDSSVDGHFDVLTDHKGAAYPTSSVAAGPLIDEAKLFDIPMPLQATSATTAVCSSADDVFISYRTTIGPRELVLFYVREMERVGWQLLAENSNAQEVTLIFDKPHKICVVTLRNKHISKEGYTVVVATSSKK